MKRFRFENISLLSQSEKRAKKVTFNPRRNLIVGRNHTGKSSLIKALFLTLGARSDGSLDRWDENAVTLVTFAINEQRYHALRQQNFRALFASDGQLLHVATNISDWSKVFAEVIGFNLVLTDKHQNIVQADARAFFLPFYINQDASWRSDWMTFTGIQQYKAPVKPILEYFTGVKPPEYYAISSMRTLVQNALKEIQREQRLLDQVRARFGTTLSLSGPKTVPVIFEQDITRLTYEMTKLNEQQEKLRDTSVREQEVLHSLTLQVKLAQDALGTFEGDAKYLRAEQDETLVCPTCGAEHDKTFMDVLTYVEDARVLRELVARLYEDEIKAASSLRRTCEQLRELDEHYNRVSTILETRRGDLKFEDVVKSLGAEVAFEAFEGELAALKEKIDDCLSKIETFDAQLSELTSRERSKKILKLFIDSYIAASNALNCPPINVEKLRLTSRPDVSGSGGPRFSFGVLCCFVEGILRRLWLLFSSARNRFASAIGTGRDQFTKDDRICCQKSSRGITGIVGD